MKRAFVSGGSGFVGRTLIAELRARGVAVGALARSAAAEAAVREAGGEPIRGDLDDRAAIDAGVTGCDVVFHTAAIVGDWDDLRLFERVNVTGTEQMLAAAQAAGVPRFVHVSTDAVLAGPDPISGAREDAPLPPDPYGPYAQTKSRAEQRVRAANAPGFATVVVRPGFIWGRGDTSMLPKIVAAVRAGRYRWIDGGNHLASTTHVRNAVEGLILAADRGCPGEVYFITDGPPMPYRHYITQLLQTQGVRPSRRSLPRRLAWPIAGVVEAIWRTFGLRAERPISRFTVKMMGEEFTIDDSKARRELGYVGRVGFEEGIREMHDEGSTAARATLARGRHAAGPLR
jgi:nucleoside-diphosphate-sugar epimerase